MTSPERRPGGTSSIWLGWYKDESGSLSSCVSEGAAPSTQPSPTRRARPLRSWLEAARGPAVRGDGYAVCTFRLRVRQHNVSLADDGGWRRRRRRCSRRPIRSRHRVCGRGHLWVIPMILVRGGSRVLRARRRRPSPAAPSRREPRAAQPLRRGETRRLAAARRSTQRPHAVESPARSCCLLDAMSITVGRHPRPHAASSDLALSSVRRAPGAGPAWDGVLSFSRLRAVMRIEIAVRVLCWIGRAVLYGFLLALTTRHAAAMSPPSAALRRRTCSQRDDRQRSTPAADG